MAKKIIIELPYVQGGFTLQGLVAQLYKQFGIKQKEVKNLSQDGFSTRFGRNPKHCSTKQIEKAFDHNRFEVVKISIEVREKKES